MGLGEALAHVIKLRTEEMCYKNFIRCTAIQDTNCGDEYCGVSLTHLESRTAEAVSDLPQLLANILPILAGSVVSWHNWRLIITAGASAASWASW